MTWERISDLVTLFELPRASDHQLPTTAVQGFPGVIPNYRNVQVAPSRIRSEEIKMSDNL
jgi:hypothetical protein